MMEVISKAGKDLDTLNTLEDTDIQNIMKIATGKLCGDFGQELFAVEQIVYGALPLCLCQIPSFRHSIFRYD